MGILQRAPRRSTQPAPEGPRTPPIDPAGIGRRPSAGRRRLLAKLVLASVGAVSVVAGAVPGVVSEAAAAVSSRYLGFDVSWPNCGRTLPSGTVLAVVGVTGGKAFTRNPCFRAEYLAARRLGVVRFYINLNKPTGTIGMTGPAGRCSSTNLSCQAYNYGYRAAAAAWSYAADQIGAAPLRTRWWLDVETMNSWSSHPSLNARVIAGALRFLTRPYRADRVGIYSTNYQWRLIAGTYRPGIAVWYATVATSASQAAAYCGTRHAFTGGAVRMVQYQAGGLDRDYLCH